MTISAHEIEAWVGTTKLGIIDASITLDETWNPYAQASITIPLSQGVIPYLDPRLGARIKLYASQYYGISDKFSVISATYPTQKLSTLSTAWTGKTIGQFSSYYFAPYNASGSNGLSTLSSLYGGQTISTLSTAWTGKYFYQISEMYSRSYPSGIFNNYTRNFDLTVRSRVVNIDDATISLDLASDEALLQDYALVQDVNYSPGTTDLRSIVKLVLARIGDSLAPGTTTATVDANAALWTPGQTAWDYLTAMLSQAKLRLFCDETRNWYLVEDTYIAPGITELFSNETITSANEDISRDNDEWFDAVVVKYTWTNDGGATVVSYDTASTPGFKKVKLIEVNSLYPGAGAAQRILNRAISRGRQKDVTAVNNYGVTPSSACNIYISGYDTEIGYVRSVSWSLPGDVMTVTTRQPVNN